MIGDVLGRIIRTIVPGAIAWLAGVLGLPEEWATDATLTVTLGLFAGYYLLAAWLETRWPRLGWLLGVPKSKTV